MCRAAGGESHRGLRGVVGLSFWTFLLEAYMCESLCVSELLWCTKETRWRQMGKFNPNINQIITHFVSAGVQRFSLASNALQPRSKSAYERHGFQCHSHKYIRGSYIQKSSHINKLPHAFTALEIKSVPGHEEEVHAPTKTHTPATVRQRVRSAEEIHNYTPPYTHT